MAQDYPQNQQDADDKKGQLDVGNFPSLPSELTKALSISIVDDKSNVPLLTLRREATEPTKIENDSFSNGFEVRPCKCTDSEAIDKIMRIPWPHQPEFRNPKYWTKEFLKPKSKTFGMVIESVKKSNDSQDKQNDSNGKNKNKDKNQSKNNKNEINNKKEDINNLNTTVVGFAMYRWWQPEYYEDSPHGAWHWWIEDFKIWRYDTDFNKKKFETNVNKNSLIKKNHNLYDNWHKLNTHMVHITDVAIHPNYRGKGLGSQLMQTLVYSFPSGTRFGLEVEQTNIGALKCYTKCGFEIQREIMNYYGKNRHCYKMTITSNFTLKDIDNWLINQKFYRKNKFEMYLKEIKAQLQVKSKVVVTEEKESKQNDNNNKENKTSNNDKKNGKRDKSVQDVSVESKTAESKTTEDFPKFKPLSLRAFSMNVLQNPSVLQLKLFDKNKSQTDLFVPPACQVSNKINKGLKHDEKKENNGNGAASTYEIRPCRVEGELFFLFLFYFYFIFFFLCVCFEEWSICYLNVIVVFLAFENVM